MDLTFKPLPAQDKAFKYLEDKKINYVLFGAAASVGKTRLLCSWLIINCLRYKGSRWLIARSRLSSLKKSTLKTFLDVTREWNLLRYYKINYQDNIIIFNNGSEIILFDAFPYPSDPDFVRLGSVELTGAAIDEAAETTENFFNILTSRIRYKLNEFDLTPKILITTNPCKNWIYRKFYKPYIDGTLKSNFRFIASSPLDNPYNPKEYLEVLMNLDPINRARLFEGNWDYSESDLDIFIYENIIDNFNNPQINGNKYITADIADSGLDSSVIIVWNGYNIIEIKIMHTTENIVQDEIANLMIKHSVYRSNVGVDATGLGVGIANRLKCVAFKSQESAMNKENYYNLKSQCAFKLAQLINNRMLNIPFHIDKISEELQVYKRYDVDKDGKTRITPKEKVKQILGRSPDFADAMFIRIYFDLKKNNVSFGKIYI
jgi:phage terminase large subunit